MLELLFSSCPVLPTSGVLLVTRRAPKLGALVHERPCSGLAPGGRLEEFRELDGDAVWVGTEAHPEFKSRPNRPAP